MKPLFKTAGKPLLQIRIPLSYFLLIILLALGTISWEQHRIVKISHKKETLLAPVTDCPSFMNQVRGFGHELTRPLYLSDVETESANLQPLKTDISQALESQKNSGNITTASVYIRMISNGSWININPDQRYDPGSMMKVAMLINYLKHEEKDKSLLDKEIFFKGVNFNIPVPFFKDKMIDPGKSYKVKDLIYHMIVNSDNYATVALNQLLPVESERYIFRDLGIVLPDDTDPRIRLTASEYARLLRVLYNSTYLSNDKCEFAMNLLTQATFKDGITRYLPSNIKVAHKFGEQEDGPNRELSECAIVYNGDNSYLITIMTEGKDMTILSNILADISKLVFERIHS